MSQNSSSTGPYHRLMREQAARGSPIDRYLAPTTESEHEIHRYYWDMQEELRGMHNGEGSSQPVLGMPTLNGMGMNPEEAKFVKDLDEGLILHKGVLEDHHKKILWTFDQVDALWFQATKERRAKEKLQREMKITWFFMLLLSVVLAYVLYLQN
jgi:hypothetical protein